MEQRKTDIEDALAWVKTGTETQNLDPFERGNHKLKSISGTFGLADLSAVSMRINTSLYEEEPYQKNKAGSRLTAMVNSILGNNSASAFVQTDSREISDLGPLLEDCKNLVATKAQAKTINIEVSLGSDLSTFSFNPYLLKKIIGNLLDNAVRHNPERGPITLAAAQRGPHVVITVSDHTGGFTVENLEKTQSLFSVRTIFLTRLIAEMTCLPTVSGWAKQPSWF